MRAIVIGNFDGVHLGHQRLFAAARARAAEVWAVTFEPLPAAVLRPDVSMGRLHTGPRARADICAALCGVREVLELEPTPNFSDARPADSSALSRRESRSTSWSRVPTSASAVLVLDASRRSGNLVPARGFAVEVVDAVEVELADGTRVEARSSTARALLAEGRVEDAARVFGRPYELRCPTTRGDQRGRTIGWPTANLDATGRILPADGVYAGEATLPDGRIAIAAISVGTKPTFGESARTCETTLLDRSGQPIALPLDWYGWTLRLRFHARIRGMVRFDGLSALLEATWKRDRVAIVHAMRSHEGLR
jgi:riboflavin kinase/FMN adenylyltransferase